ncbi:MAG TPA: ABC transporter permease [Blastocatellia bacterium]|nr:ABC transporter permease [Blastocatellia bacterium]
MGLEKWLYTVPLRLRSLFRRKSVEQGLDDEFQCHLDRKREQYISSGLNPDQARCAALRDLDGLERQKERCRDARRVGLIEDLLQDLRYGLRMLRRSPGFTAVALLSLGLGIGANTAVFTLINALFLRELPVTRPQELVTVKGQRAGGFGLISFPMYRDLRDRQEVFTDMLASAGETPCRITIPGSDGAAAELDNMRVSFVSGNYFDILGVGSAIGRLLTPEDDRSPNTSETLGSVVVLSYDFWKHQFGPNTVVLNRTILIGRSACKIVGVAPRGFFGEAVGNSPSAWVPLVPFSSPDNLENRQGTFTAYMARLKPGVAREQAQAAMTVLYEQLLAAEGRVRERIEDNTIALDPGDTGMDYVWRRTFAKPLRIVAVIVALVLLIATVNVANLLLARAAARRGEIAARLALGCARSRLVRQLLTESFLLSFAGAIAGVGLAYISSPILLHLISSGPAPIILSQSPDVRVLAFLVAVGVATGIGFGLVPALQATRVEVASAIKSTLNSETGRHAKQRLGRLLIVFQVTLSLVLLAGSLLLIRSFHNLHNMDWGFRKDRVVIFDLAHNPQNREPTALAQVAWQARQRVAQVDGVESVSVSGLLLFSPSDIGAPLTVRDYTPAPGENVFARFNSVSPGYFETVGMSLLEGRGIEESDRQDAPKIAVVNEAMARRYFRDGRSVGGCIEIAQRLPASMGFAKNSGSSNQTPIQVVGVVRDAKYNNLRQDAQPMFYVPIAQMPRSLRSLEVLTSRSLSEIAGPVQNALAGVSTDLMIRRVVSLSDQVDQSLAGERLIMDLCSFFGGLAILLACVGLYGVLSYAVAQRKSEIGIRMAVGATRQSVLWLVLRETTYILLAGAAVGIPVILGSTRFVTAFLYGLTPADPATIAAATILLFIAAFLASLGPALRASRVDPMVALRYE